MKVSIVTLGCKVNEYESQSMLNQFKQAGYEICEGLVPADIYIVNTCAVTNTAEKKSKQVLAKIEKLNNKAQVVCCGCAVQNNAKQFLKHPQVVAVCGNQGKNHIVDIFNSQIKELEDINNLRYTSCLAPAETRTRQFIKIQDGCNYFCTYCLIPYMRGRSRSREMQEILTEIQNSTAKEIVLTGINMSDYQIDGKLALKTLVKEVDKLNKRFRISSIECNVLDEEMLQTLKDCKNFCPHFHLSLQSACNETLKRMNRRYTIEFFIDVVDKIKRMFPTAFIATDIIVGFKGETNQEFKDTLKNLKRIKFSAMHIFPYSVRSGTVASKMPGDVDSVTTKQREQQLQQLNKEFKNDFYKANLNTYHSVLVEEIVDQHTSLGYTDNYIYTTIPSNCAVGQMVNVKLVSINKTGMVGEIVKEKL